MKPQQHNFDDADRRILRALQGNARLTIKEIAAEVGLSSTPVFERLKRLEKGGFIKGYVTILDADKLDLGFTVFCNVKLKRINRDITMDFVSRIQELSEVTECYNVSGNFDFMLKVRVQDMKSYQQFILNRLGVIESVAHIESTFVMKEEKQTYGVNITTKDDKPYFAMNI
ncbi:MAG: Lrp/AsnC family transcriptional regulator [Bacteroidaceae bacterium]|nr:Lrp/AsnC family transcriptional regulator [Prevotellaceae bacterium]MDY5632582.1 Lrp/AsnC family transcriptional regulator [Bacteroidaceae bacterium]